MPRSRRHLTLLSFAVCAAVSGCGSSDDTTRTAAAPKASTKQSSAPLRVGGTDARVGDATTANSRDGVRELRVPKRKVDPRAVKRRADRQAVGAGASCTDTDLIPSAENLAAVRASTLCLLNGERTDAGLTPLSLNEKLAQSAQAHNDDMISQGYFDHTGRDGSDVVKRVRATGYITADRAWTVGENLAWGTGTLATPKGILNAWMNSEGHRANILKAEYREIGFGVSVGNPRSDNGQGATYTSNFGATAGGETSPVSAPATGTTGSTTPVAKRKASVAKRKALARKRARKARRAKAAKRRAAAARRSTQR